MADIQISDLPGRTTPAGTDLMHVEASGADYKAELSALVNAVTDAAPTEDSPAPVSSGGMFDALAGIASDIGNLETSKQDALTFDDAPVENSNNPVKSGGLYTALAGKQNALTFDDAPVENSNNPVKSGGVYDYINTLPTVELTVSGLKITIYRLANIFIVILYGTYTGTTSQNVMDFGTITNNDFKPTQTVSLVLMNVSNDKPQGQLVIGTDGKISLYGGYDTITNGKQFAVSGIYVK